MTPGPLRNIGRGTFNKRTPEPEISEILGPLLGFGANSLLSGLGGLFGKDKPETADEYLKSIGVEDAAIEDKSLLSEIDRAKYDAYRVYGAPTEKDGFGLDEIANLAIASQMGRGGPGFIKGVLDSKKATETDRLQTQVKRQAYVNELLKPVSLKSIDLEDTNPDSPTFGQTIKAAWDDKNNTFTRLGSNEKLDFENFKVADNLRVFNDVQDFAKAKNGLLDVRRSYVDQNTNLLMVQALTPEEIERSNDEGFIAGNSIEGAQWLKYDSQAVKSLREMTNDPELKQLRVIIDSLNKADYPPLAMISVANSTLKILDEYGSEAGSPLTLTSELLNLGNNGLANFDQIAREMAGSTSNFFATEASVRAGLSTTGTGDDARLLYQALSATPNGAYNETTGSVDYSPTQLRALEYAEKQFEENNSAALGGQTIRDLLGESAYNNTRVKGAMLQLAYMAAAANGQTGRTLSDKDLAFHLKMVGFGQTSNAKTLKHNLIDFVDQVVGFQDDRIESEFPVSTMRRYNLENEDHQYEIGSVYKPAQKEERVFEPNNPEADEDGYVVYTSDDWENTDMYQRKTFTERHSKSKEIKLWNTHYSPARDSRQQESRRNKNRIAGAGSIDFLLKNTKD